MSPAIYLVNSDADAGNPDPTDPDKGDLRYCINRSNDNPGATPNTILFGIGIDGGVKTIQLGNPISITAPVLIDGYTQMGAQYNNQQFSDNAVLKIVLDGGNKAAAGLIVNAKDTTIRGLVFSNFTQDGIRVQNKAGFSAVTNVKITGNFIGTNDTGTAIAANGGDGVFVATGATLVTIGGTTPADRNIISGNTQSGIHIFGNDGAGKVTVQGNFIGTDKSGTKALPNGDGVLINNNSSQNLIGTAAAGARNVISGNSQVGVHIEGADSFLNQIVQNFIGTDPNAAIEVPNQAGGVWINDASFTIVGGSDLTAGNIISGNSGNGVTLSGGATLNQLLNNYIGTNANGTIAIANTGDGVSVQASGNRIGSTGQFDRNVISGNSGDGISINATNTIVQGNYIGLNAAGNAKVRNILNGIRISGGVNNRIGGPGAGERNVISGNGTPGVGAEGNGIRILGGNLTTIQGNFIGTDATGKKAVDAQGIKIGNAVDGISVEAGTPNTTIGGTNPGEGNIISGNLGKGIFDGGVGTVDKGNKVGKNVNGDPLPNEKDGEKLGGNSSNTERNEIWWNLGNGVVVVAGTGNRISQDSIAFNAALGIDLGDDGVTLNDPGDADEGPNRLQNFPELTVVVQNGDGTTHVEGTIDSDPQYSTYPITIEFFNNSVPDPSGYGEGEIYLGSLVVTGPGSFSIDLPAAAYITATATDAAWNTSEFSAWVQVDVPIIVDLSSNTGPTMGGNSILLRGRNFRNISNVLFGAAAASFTVLSSTLISATVPAQDVGTVDVRAVGRRGLSLIRAAARYTYSDAPPPPPPPAPPSRADFPSEELSSGSAGLPNDELVAVSMLLSGAEETDYAPESTVGGFSTGPQSGAEPAADPLDPSRVDDFLATIPVPESAKKDGINRNDSLKKLDLDAILAPPGNGLGGWVIDSYPGP